MLYALMRLKPYILRQRRLVCRKLRNFCRSPLNYIIVWGTDTNYLQLGSMDSVTTAISKWRNVRSTVFVLGFLYVVVLAATTWISVECEGDLTAPVIIIGVSAGVRILWMFGNAKAQAATASVILEQQVGEFGAGSAVRKQRRMTYKRWLWWSRFGILVTIMQMVGATYFVIIIVNKSRHEHSSSSCYPGINSHGGVWKQIIVVTLAIIAWLLVIAQCCAGSDVLKWRSFYATHDAAWKAHYREIFDHGIREVLCCLGRFQYLSILEADEVDSVAGLLGDLVAYRASGAGHLEFLAGLALLQRQRPVLPSLEQFAEAPEDKLQEAVILHPFAEAAYTGPLLDVGRNPILFPCVWLYRQGILTPWSRSRRPVLEGDNWWRGHAAAFLKYLNLPPNALRKGRVHQARREAAYFVVVAHHLRCVIISVRGTETPEDLLTDGLCRECMLSESDLYGLVKSNALEENVKERVALSFPHFGHSGIVEAARDLCMQLDGNSEDGYQMALSLDQTCGSCDVPGGSQNVSHHQKTGLLSSLLGPGGECQGYALRFVGHSLGGAIGALAGIMLYKRYPSLHAYSYGVLPCVDAVVADACSGFVTSIIYNDEFSARLSVNSILRLRAAALAALAADSSADSAMISKLTGRLLHANKYFQGESGDVCVQASQSSSIISRDNNQTRRQKHIKYAIKGGIFLCYCATSCVANMPKYSSTHPVRNHIKCKLHASFEGDFLNDGKHRDVIVDASEIEGSLTSGNRRQSISDKETSALDAGDESRDHVSFEERTILIQNSDAENPGNNQEDATYKETNANEFCIHSSGSIIAENTIYGNSVPQPMDANLEYDTAEREPVEMFVPGLVIHIVPDAKPNTWFPWRNWNWIRGQDHSHRAILRRRESFKDIRVSPSMFVDHMPWRCHYAMQKVLETRSMRNRDNSDRLDSSDLV